MVDSVPSQPSGVAMKYITRLLICMVAALILGTVFMIAAYNCESQLFNKYFDQMLEIRTVTEAGRDSYVGAKELPAYSGRGIEWARLILACLLTSWALANGFRKEVHEMTTCRPVKRVRSIVRRLVRARGPSESLPSKVFQILLLARPILLWFVYGSFAALVVCYEASMCFRQGTSGYPFQLVVRGWRDGLIPETHVAIESSLREATAAYSCYMVYSAMFYGFIVPLLVTIPMMTSFYDMILWRSRLRQIERMQSPGAVLFVRYAEGLAERTRSYLNVAGAVAAFVWFQEFVGKYTLSDTANSSAFSASIISGVSLCFVGAAWYLYFVAWHHVCKGEVDKTVREQDPSSWTQHLLKTCPGGYAILGLVLSNGVASQAIAGTFRLFGVAVG
jgi:hypothetical protein